MALQGQFQAIGDIGGGLLFVGDPRGHIIRDMERAEGHFQITGQLVDLCAQLAQLAIGDTDGGQILGQISDTAIIQRQRRIPGPGRILEMPLNCFRR